MSNTNNLAYTFSFHLSRSGRIASAFFLKKVLKYLHHNHKEVIFVV